MVIEGNVVRSYDAETGAARITYGTITLPNAPLTSVAYFSFLSAWGQPGVLTQYIGDPGAPASQSGVNYFIKTDQAGISAIVMP